MTDPQDLRSGERAEAPAESTFVGAPPPVRARHLMEQDGGETVTAPSGGEPAVTPPVAGPPVPVAGLPVPATGLPVPATGLPVPATVSARWRADTTDPGKDARGDEPTRERLLRVLLGPRRLALGARARDRLVDVVGTVLVVALAAAARLVNLGRPGELVFDETYYVKDAFTLGRLGFEARWPETPNPAFEAGSVETYLDQAAYVVHPQVGKWLISLGMDVAGGATSPFAWRFANAVVGILAVLLIIRVARRLFASTPMGLVAGLLLAVDGQAIVHSRVALLDQYVMFFALLAFALLLVDRDWARRRLAERVGAILDAGGSVARYGPRLGFRWWRLAAGVSLGLACGVKWSGLYFVAVFGLLTVLWDVTARRRAGIGRWWEDAVVADGLPAFAQIVPTALAVYVASWWSWFATPGAYLRQWAAQNPGEGITWLPEALRSFVHYHQQMWNFHTGLASEHPYQSHPLGWIVQWRSTSFHWECYRPDGGACQPGDTVSAINAIGNPLLWWLAAAAILVVIVVGVMRRDWRAPAVLSGTIAGWLPWVVMSLQSQRTVFTFYTIAFTPWVVLTLVYVGAVALEHTEGWRRARRVAVTVIAVVVVAIVAVSVLFYPLWTAQEVSRDYWGQIVRFSNWV